jgi:hypothetical protein
MCVFRGISSRAGKGSAEVHLKYYDWAVLFCQMLTPEQLLTMVVAHPDIDSISKTQARLRQRLLRRGLPKETCGIYRLG